MCIIGVIKKGTKIVSYNDFSKQFDSNHDGFGVAAGWGDKIRLEKGILSKKDAYDVLTSFHKKSKTDVIYHLRLATSGKIDIKTCHPFMIENIGILFHNGVISHWGTQKLSDTQELAAILSKIGDEKIAIKLLKKLNSNGDGKFALLNLDGKTIKIGNYDKINNVFYSNLRWQGYNYNYGYNVFESISQKQKQKQKSDSYHFWENEEKTDDIDDSFEKYGLSESDFISDGNDDKKLRKIIN